MYFCHFLFKRTKMNPVTVRLLDAQRKSQIITSEAVKVDSSACRDTVQFPLSSFLCPCSVSHQICDDATTTQYIVIPQLP